MDTSKPFSVAPTGVPHAPNLSGLKPRHIPEPAGSIGHFHQLIESGALDSLLERLGRKVKK